MNRLKSFVYSFVNGFGRFGHLVASSVNFVLLLIVYFTVLGATSVIGKVFGKEFLMLKTKKSSNWIEREPVSKKIDDYYRPF